MFKIFKKYNFKTYFEFIYTYNIKYKIKFLNKFR